MELSDVLQGKEVRHGSGSLYVVESSVDNLNIKPLRSAIRAGYPHLRQEIMAQTFPSSPAYRKNGESNPAHLLDKMLFIDIETRGLAHRHPIFLISLGQYEGEGMKLTALFARDYSEERPMLQYFLDLLHHSKAQVTFNGGRFDLPHIGRRSQHQGVMINGYKYRELTDVLRESHLDLRDYETGKLQDIEKLRFRFVRKGDVPGSAIPGIYHSYVYGKGNQEKIVKQVAGIVLHNLIDVVSVGALFADMCRETGEAHAQGHKLAA